MSDQDFNRTFGDYQFLAEKTAIYPEQYAVNYSILGLVGEAGELANKYKKVLRDDLGVLSTEKRNELVDELGDVLWYLSAIATDLEVNLGEVAMQNIRKLQDRQSRNVLGGSGDKR